MSRKKEYNPPQECHSPKVHRLLSEIPRSLTFWSILILLLTIGIIVCVLLMLRRLPGMQVNLLDRLL